MLESGVSTANVRTISVNEMYVRALNGQSSAAVCADERRAAGNPGLSGRVELKRVKLGLGRIPKDVRVSSSTLRSKEIDACIERALLAVKAAGVTRWKTARHRLCASSSTSPIATMDPQRCSAASRAYLQVRRSLWRERLPAIPASRGDDGLSRSGGALMSLRPG